MKPACKARCGNLLLTPEESEGKLKGLCNACRAKIAEKALVTAQKVERGHAKETCGKCRSCDGDLSKVKSGGYAHAIIPQSLIKKTDIIILRFLTVVYSSALERSLNADTLDINPAIFETCMMVQENICSLEPENRDVLGSIYLKWIRILEAQIYQCVCPCSSASSSSSSSSSSITSMISSSSSSSSPFCLPQRFTHLSGVTGLVHITEIIGKGSLERFGIGKQCKTCEENQGDDSLLVRHDRFRIERSHPPTFVGNKCLAMIGEKTVRTFVWNWLRTDSTEEPCVLNDIFRQIKKPDSAATKVLIKLKDVFACFYSLHIIAMADGFPLCATGLDEMLEPVYRKLPPPPKTSSSSKDAEADEEEGLFLQIPDTEGTKEVKEREGEESKRVLKGREDDNDGQ